MELIKINFKNTDGKIEHMNSVNNAGISSNALELLKSYCSASYFSSLWKRGKYVKSECSSDDIYVCAATDGKGCGVLLTRYNDNDEAEAKSVDIVLQSIPKNSLLRAYVLDKSNNMTQYYETSCEHKRIELILDLPSYTSHYIEIIKQ